MSPTVAFCFLPLFSFFNNYLVHIATERLSQSSISLLVILPSFDLPFLLLNKCCTLRNKKFRRTTHTHTGAPLSVRSLKTSSKTDSNAIAKFSMSWSQQAPLISKHMFLRMYPTRFIINVWFELLPLLRILMSTMRSFGKRPRTTHREKTLFRQAGADRNAKCSIRWCRRAMHIN